MFELMTQEEQDAVIKRVWNDSKERITKDVESAIREQLYTNFRSTLSKMAATQLREILLPLFEARREEMLAQAKSHVDSYFANLGAKIETMMREFNTSWQVQKTFNDFGQSVSYALQKAFSEVLSGKNQE